MDSSFLYMMPEVEKTGPNSRSCREKLFLLFLLKLCVILFIFVTLFLRNYSISDKSPLHSNSNATGLSTKAISENINRTNIQTKNISNTNEVKFENFVAAKEHFIGFENINDWENSDEDQDEFSNSGNVKVSERVSSFGNNTTLGNNSGLVSPKTDMNKNCVQSPFDKEFVKTLSPSQLMAVEQLKQKARENLTYTYCDTISENFLSHLLQVKNWDAKVAGEALLKTLEWRKQERIGELSKEDFSYFEDVYPVLTDGRDYTGRLVVTYDTSTVDPRKIMLAGKGPQMLRYLIRCAETSLNIVREAQMKGQNVTQGILIVNAKGFNMRQHGCDKCLTFMYKYFEIVEDHYPGAFFKIFVINTPADLEWLLYLIKAVLPSDVVASMEIYGMNKEEWQEAILKFVPADQIRPEFGGTKNTDDD